MRFFGEVGYGETVEVMTEPDDPEETPSGSGVWVDEITEVQYYGDVVRNSRKLESGENLNSDLSVLNSISIIADDYAIAHYFKIKYVRWEGVLWTVTDVEVRRPRLILSLGSVYNGPTPQTS